MHGKKVAAFAVVQMKSRRMEDASASSRSEEGKMLVRVIAALAAALAIGGVFAPTSLSVRPCWPDCEQEPPEQLPPKPPYQADPIGLWDYRVVHNGYGTVSAWDDRLIITGWTFDWDVAPNPIWVRVDVYADSAGTQFQYSQLVLANLIRGDLPFEYAAYAGLKHGFRVEVPYLPLTSAGRRACLTALNAGAGADQLLYSTSHGSECVRWVLLE
jgi:hypothetical protein